MHTYVHTYLYMKNSSMCTYVPTLHLYVHTYVHIRNIYVCTYVCGWIQCIRVHAVSTYVHIVSTSNPPPPLLHRVCRLWCQPAGNWRLVQSLPNSWKWAYNTLLCSARVLVFLNLFTRPNCFTSSLSSWWATTWMLDPGTNRVTDLSSTF